MTSEVDKKRLAPFGIVVKALESVRVMVYAIVLPALGGGGTAVFAETLIVSLMALGIAVGSIGLGFVRWWRFEYWIEDGQFRVEQGALIRKKTYIPLEKVQATDITVGIIQRLLGLVQLEIKTGAAGSQAKLSALTRAEAERIQSRLRAAERTEESAAEPPVDSTHRLTVQQLMLAGATSGKLGYVLGGIAWIFSQVSDAFFETMVESLNFDFDPEQVMQTDPLIVVGLMVVGLLVSWLGSVVWELLTYGGFEASKRGDDIVIRRGIFEQHQITLPIRRVQAVRYHETLLRQPFGYGTLYIEAVGHQEEKGQATVLHPFLSRADSQKLIAELLPKFDVEYNYLRPPKRALPRFLIKPTVVVGLPVGIAAWWWTPALVGLLALPLIWLIGYVSWRDVGLSLGDDIAVVRSRSLLRRTTAILLRDTTQVAAASSSVLQRRRDLSSVALTVATGAVGRTFTARDLDSGDAWETLRWVIAKHPPHSHVYPTSVPPPGRP